MTFDKPIRPTKQPSSAPQKTNLATQKVVPNPVKKVIPNIIGGGGNSGNKGGGVSGGGGNGGNQEPSPWLMGESPKKIDPSASFVEYLRWMRSLDQGNKDGTKLQILQLSEDKADYSKRLAKLTERTKKIAGEGNYFQVKCPWRIRVGGHRGPESILLPAFDALGMPFIPSSTLRGVARAEALRQLNNDEKEVEKFFGSLDAKDSDRMGKIVFLDAYPVASRDDKSGGLTVDMANNIWTWNGDRLDYAPNPNPFLSLQEPIFLIGIRAVSTVSDAAKKALIDKVMGWLTAGLKNGAGSQVNSGYGYLREENTTSLPTGFLSLDFEVRGQLVHGSQKIVDLSDPYLPNGRLNQSPVEELRPIAIKSIMRYWFRAFALGKLPATDVREIENKIFGGINPRYRGYIGVHVYEDKKVHTPNAQRQGDPHGLQKGKLILIRSQEPLEIGISNPIGYEAAIQTLSKSLVWLMFHLGGVGLGARRPLYSRNRKNGRRPWWRGSRLTMLRNQIFGDSPKNPAEFKTVFQNKVREFYTALGIIYENSLSPNLLSAGNITSDIWYEAIDQNSSVFVMQSPVSKQTNVSKAIQRSQSSITTTGEKPLVLDTLHGIFHSLFDDYQQNKHNPDREIKRIALQNLTKAKNLCGHTDKDRIRINSEFQERKAIPSPVWIADLGDYQVVTVFGATQEPRKGFLNKLINGGAIQVFPIT